MKISRQIVFCCLMILLIMFFSGCRKTLEYESIANHINVAENSKYGLIDMKFDLLNGKDIRTFQTKAGITYEFNYNIDMQSGDIRVMFTDSNDNIIEDIGWFSEHKKAFEEENKWQVNLNGIGGIKKVKSIDDKIKVVIEGKDAQGYVKISW